MSEREKERIKKVEYDDQFSSSKPKEIPWIEKLLKTPIEDHRKLCLWRILIPYLVNIKNVQESETFLILEKWIKDCDKKRKINFDYIYTIKSDLKRVNDYKPISLEYLKEKYPDLYSLVVD